MLYMIEFGCCYSLMWEDSGECRMCLPWLVEAAAAAAAEQRPQRLHSTGSQPVSREAAAARCLALNIYM